MIGLPREQPEAGPGSHLPISKLGNPKQQEFLWAIREKGTMQAACKLTGVSTDTHYKWLREDGLYADAYAGCRVGRNQVLEECAFEEAIGKEVPIFNKVGHQIGTKIVRDNKMLWNMLCTHHPAYAKNLRGGDQNVMVAGTVPDVQIILPSNGRSDNGD